MQPCGGRCGRSRMGLPVDTPFIVRDALPVDIPGIMRLKLELAIADDIADTVRATASDWQRDGFGQNARFIIFVAVCAGRVVGIAICAERYFPGWVGPTIALLDFFVEQDHRGRGIGAALLTRVAALAKARGSVMVELAVRTGNRAAALYERLGFVEVIDARTYVVAGAALDRLAVPAPARLAG
jgi:GNAT superfamily N-acetyltransferase